MDIEDEVELNGFHVWSSICIHAVNQNAYPAVSEDVLAPLPTWTTRVNKNGDDPAFFNSVAENAVRPFSHKV